MGSTPCTQVEERLEKKRSLTSQLSEIRKTVPANLATSTNKNNDIYINGGKINGTVQLPDLNNVFTSEKIDIPSATGKAKTDKGYTVQARVYVTHSMQQVRSAYTNTFKTPSSASAAHNTLVYRVKNDRNNFINKGWTDHGKYGMGRIVLNFLVKEGFLNVTAVITKHHSGKTGSFAKRSDIVNQSVKEACEQLIASSTLTRNTEPAPMQHQQQHQRPANSTAMTQEHVQKQEHQQTQVSKPQHTVKYSDLI